MTKTTTIQARGRAREVTRHERLIRNTAASQSKNLVEVAREIGISQQTLYDWFASRRPRNRTAARIVRWLNANGVTISVFDLTT